MAWRACVTPVIPVAEAVASNKPVGQRSEIVGIGERQETFFSIALQYMALGLVWDGLLLVAIRDFLYTELGTSLPVELSVS